MTIELLIREIEPSDKNGRYLRENLRRIKQYLDDGSTGVTAITPTPVIPPSQFNYVDPFDVTVLNQTTFNLTATPQSASATTMEVNGVGLTNGTHFDIAGNIATFYPLAAGYQLETSNEFGQPDKVVFKYMV
jgi:hypothetical protein